MNYINKFYNFMNGRYGIDELYKFNLIVLSIVIIINLFLNSLILDILELLLLVILIYRFMSYNKVKRSYENKKYLKLRDKIIKKYNFIRNVINDRNTHMYKRCPKCHTYLRLPLRKGLHTCKCPKCGNRFKVRCNRDEKIKVEVVK